MINISEVIETNQMIERENLDVRTITMGISLLDCAAPDVETLTANIYDKICLRARDLVPTGEAIAREYGVPVIKPAGGLGAHLNCSEIVPDIPHDQYPAAAVGAALYIAGGIRGMERGTVSEQRNPDGSERFAELELQRLAMPRRVFTLSQVKYCADRVKWLWDNRSLIGGLQWEYEPKVLRFFFGRMKEIGYWQEDLAKKFRADFGNSL